MPYWTLSPYQLSSFPRLQVLLEDVFGSKTPENEVEELHVLLRDSEALTPWPVAPLYVSSPVLACARLLRLYICM